jgi:hypothetical protein
MLQNMHSARIQIFAIIGSIMFLVFIIELIRKRKIKEEYGLLWIVFGIIFIVIAVWNKGLEVISWLLGIFYAPAAFLLILIVAIFLILIQYSIVISRLNEKNKILAQELGILKMQFKEMSDHFSKKTITKDR